MILRQILYFILISLLIAVALPSVLANNNYTITNLDDTFIRSDNAIDPDLNFMWVGKDSPGTFFRSVFKFNFTDLNIGEITSCKFQITLRRDFVVGDFDILIYNLTKEWSDFRTANLTFNWVDDGNLIYNITEPEAYYIIDTAYNLTLPNALCQDWADNVYNYGLGLKSAFGESSASSSDQIGIYSIEDAVSSNRPILYIENKTIPLNAPVLNITYPSDSNSNGSIIGTCKDETLITSVKINDTRFINDGNATNFIFNTVSEIQDNFSSRITCYDNDNNTDSEIKNLFIDQIAPFCIGLNNYTEANSSTYNWNISCSDYKILNFSKSCTNGLNFKAESINTDTYNYINSTVLISNFDCNYIIYDSNNNKRSYFQTFRIEAEAEEPEAEPSISLEETNNLIERMFLLIAWLVLLVLTITIKGTKGKTIQFFNILQMLFGFVGGLAWIPHYFLIGFPILLSSIGFFLVYITEK